MNVSPKVIVLILSYNGKDLLEECLSSYLENDYPNFNIVLIDNGSTDGTKEYVEANFPDVYVHRTDVNLKYSGGFNFGLEYAFQQKKADLVLISNNDVRADSGIVSALADTMVRHKDAGFVTGKVYYHEQPDLLQTIGKSGDEVFWRGKNIGGKQIDKGQFEEEMELTWCDDIFWMVRRELYEITGGYDTEFAFQAEDFDWQVRAKEAGFKIYYSPKARLWHKDSTTIGKVSPFKLFFDFRNPLIVHLKYRTPEQVKPFFRRQLSHAFSFMLKNTIKGNFKHVSAVWRGNRSALKWARANGKLKRGILF